MANSDTEVQLDITVEQTQALRKIEEFRRVLGSSMDGFDAAVKKSKKEVAELTESLAKIKLPTNLVQRTRQQQKADGLIDGVIDKAGQGSLDSRANQAFVKSKIMEMTNSLEASQAKITEAIIKSITTQMRTADAMVESRLRQTTYANNQHLANNTAQMLDAKAIAAERSRQDTLFAATNGREALSSKRRMEALNYNGGADLMAVQGRVMMNYMAVGSLFNTAKDMASGIVELDKELHQFQAISASTNYEMVGFKQNLTDISKTVPFTTLEITKGATALAQAGLSTKEVTDSLGAVAMFATATGSEFGQAVDIMTSTLTAFNLETSQTGQVANIYTAALNLSKLSVDKLVTAMNYIGPTAEAMGITLQETTSVLGALSQSGVRASTMGTGFRALLTDLQEPSKKLQATLSAAGLSVDDINVKTHGFLPVIEKLKKAGFGAAEAYASLEVRAAASFVALSNNTNMAYEMQRAFTLSAAATEANAIQMESLSNTGKNFNSALTSAVFTGMEPVVRLLQNIVQWSTAALNGLNEIPGVLKTLGVVSTGLFTVIGASLGMSLLRSLTEMVPVLGTISAGFRTLGVAVLGATGFVNGLAVALARLYVMARNNWVGLLITAVAGLGLMVSTWKTRNEELAESIDKLKGKANELEGTADTTAKKISSIETAIEGVISRQTELENNPLAKNAKVDELRQQFHELGLSIQSDTASVTDLIRELHNLKQTSSRLRSSQLADTQLARGEELKALQEQQKNLTSRYSEAPEGIRNRTGLLFGSLGRNVSDPAMQGLFDKLALKFGPDISEAARVASGDLSTVKNDALRASSFNSKIGDLIGKLEKQPNSAADVAYLKSLQTDLAPIVANVMKIAELQSQIKMTEGELKISRIQGTNAYSEFGQGNDKLDQRVQKSLVDIRSGQMNTESKILAVEALKKDLEESSQKLVEDFSIALKAEMPGADPKAVTTVTQTAQTAVQALLNSLTETNAKNLTKRVSKSKLDQGKTLAAYKSQVADALDSDALEVAKKGYEDFAKLSDAQISRYYETLLAMIDKNDVDQIEKVQEEYEQYQAQRKDDDANALRDQNTKARDLLKDSIERQKLALEESAQNTQTKIDEIIKEIAKSSPGAVMDSLLWKFQELNAVLAGEKSKIDSLQVQSAAIAINLSSGSAILDLIASRESGGDYNATLDNGKWTNGPQNLTGMTINQIRDLQREMLSHPENRDKYRDAANNPVGSSALGRYQIVGRTLEGLIKSMGLTGDEMFTPEMQDRMASQLMAGRQGQGLTGLRREWPSLNSRSDAEILSALNAQKGPTLAAGLEADSKLTMEKNQADALEANLNATEKATALTQDQILKNLKSRLTTLGSQVRINDSSSSLEDIQAQIDSTYEKIMAAELKKFDADTNNINLRANGGDTGKADVSARRQELEEKIRGDLQNTTIKLMDEHQKAVEDELNRPVKEAQARLNAAQQPDMVNKYTQTDLQKMQQAVVDAQRRADANQVLAIEKEIADVKARAASAKTADEAAIWISRENDLLAKSNELKAQNLALDEARSAQSATIGAELQSATNLWAQQNGILDAQNQMIPLAKQVGNTWGEVLSGLSSGLSTFFTDVASGTMAAGDAFKKLGLSIVNMFMQIIAKALANQIIMSIFGGMTGGGDILGSLFGVVTGSAGGSANGGIPRAANGRRASPFRDNLLVNVMPGEGILRKSAMDVIGDDGFHRLNNAGNRQVSEGALAGGRLGAAANQNRPKVPDTNVYVVSPDEKPQMGPNDIVAVVADNILRRGALRQLIHTTARS